MEFINLSREQKEMRSEFERRLKKSFDISERIRFLLKQKKWTQKQLAQEMKVSSSMVSKWLSGTHNFTTNTLLKMEHKLGNEILAISSPMLYQIEPKITFDKNFYLLNCRPVPKPSFHGEFHTKIKMKVNHTGPLNSPFADAFVLERERKPNRRKSIC